MCCNFVCVCMRVCVCNLYACVVVERWLERVKDMEDVGTPMTHKFDQKLFHRSTRNQTTQLHKEEFADDVVLLVHTRQGATVATQAYVDVASSLGLTVSFAKTKFMVIGSGIIEEKLPLAVGDNTIE